MYSDKAVTLQYKLIVWLDCSFIKIITDLKLKITHVFDKFILYIAKKSSKSETSKYSPICLKFCTQAYLFMCNKGSLVGPCISNF